MKTKSLFMLTLIAVLIMAGSLATAASADNAVVPFRGTYVTHPVSGNGPPPCIIKVTITGEGEATHLGLSTWSSTLCMDPRTPPPPFPQWGDMIFTAANGDQLTGSYVGFGLPSQGSVKFWGTFTFTAGTGRFADIKGGSGTYQGWVMGESGELTFDGTLEK